MSQNATRLLEATPESVARVPAAAKVPSSLAAVLPADEGSKTLQSHSGGREGSQVFHGQGQGPGTQCRGGLTGTSHVKDAREKIRNTPHLDQTIDGAQEVVEAGIEGRVETLFVTRGATQFGTVDLQTTKVMLQDVQSQDNEDLLDRAAIATFQRGSEVFVVDPTEMPLEDRNAVALLRY